MSNKNYVKGRNFEYRTQNYLRKIGYYVIRAYGSKGLYDLIAVPPSNEKGIYNYPLLIQAKSNGKISKEELESLKLHSPKWQGFPIISYSQPKIKKDGTKSKQTDLLFRSLNGERLFDFDYLLTRK